MKIAYLLIPSVLGILGHSLAQEELPPGVLSNLGSLSQIVTQEEADGSLWIAGESYKIHYRAGGADFIPFLGPEAPRNYPLSIALRSVAIDGQELISIPAPHPELELPRVTYDHGGVIQVWRNEIHAAEQSFVIREVERRGEVVVRLAVTTDMRLVANDASGLYFETPGFGGVRYGHARILDAANREVNQRVQWHRGELVIRVPASFMHTAALPLTIDPWVNSWGVDYGGSDDIHPDVAYDLTNDHWLVTYERIVSASDHDILAKNIHFDSVTFTPVAVSLATTDERNPSVANNRASRQFLVVWEAWTASGNVSYIRGAFVDPGTSIATTPMSIARDGSGSLSHPDVGGTSEPGGPACRDCQHYFVVWEKMPFTGASPIVQGRRVATSGTPDPVVTVTPGTSSGYAPRVSKSCDPGKYWGVAYQRELASGNNDIYYALYHSSGVRVDDGVVSSDSSDERNPDIAGNGDSFMVVWEKEDRVPLARDIVGVRYDRAGSSLLNISGVVNLTDSEPGGSGSRDQYLPAVGTDCCRFTYTYTESNAGDTNIVGNTIHMGTTIVWDEAHRLLHATPFPEYSSQLASKFDSGGGAIDYVVAIDRRTFNGGPDSNISAIIYRGTNGNLAGGLTGLTSIDTGCSAQGTQEPTLEADMVPGLGALVSVELQNVTPAGLYIMILGTPVPAPVPLCGPCSVGTFPVWAALSSRVIHFQIPCNPFLLGASLAVQGWNLGSTTPGCMLGLLPTSASDTLVLTIH